ncbi:MAG: YfiR family protein [Terracidiphilus sp.]
MRVNLPGLCLLLFALVFHVTVTGTARAQSASDEYRLKAAFLFHFAQLVEWPDDAFDGNSNSLVLCTLEDDALYDELESTIQGKQIGARTIRVRHIHMSQATHGCNILFIGKSEGKGLPLAALRKLPVLTVGEAEDFVSSGGIIRFYFEQDRIRFDINLGAADSSHLKISSRLLLLATSVTKGSGAGEGR